MPSGPPRKIEVEAVNSSSVKVLWRSPVPNRQHGQIRGYQVNYVRMVNGEPVGHPVIKDILIDDAQVGTHLHSCTASQVNRYRLWRVLWLWHSSYSQLLTLSIVCVCVSGTQTYGGRESSLLVLFLFAFGFLGRHTNVNFRTLSQTSEQWWFYKSSKSTIAFQKMWCK